MIIFLDFDGVLHAIPSGENGRFFHIDRIEAIVREFPFLKIVISSSWREVYPEDVVVGIFSEDIQQSIIGMTPIIDDKLPLLRYREIQAWIEAHQYEGPWLAIDDAVYEFPDNEPHLFRCETSVGFDEAAFAELRLRLGWQQF